MSSRDYFKGKRVAVVGLGPHGEMVADVKFLIKAGALVALYDLRSEARLKNHLVFLRSLGLANYVCGSVPAEDLLDMDLVILSHEYPRDSSFLKQVREKNIAIEYPETLFFRLAPPVTLVGVMGPYGKSTVMSLVEPMLVSACKAQDDQGFFVIDSESEVGVLAHIKRIKNGDLVLMRVAESMMRELFAIRISPHVAVFTGLPSEGTYTTSAFEVLSYQTYNNFIIASDAVIDVLREDPIKSKAKMLRTKSSLIPADWEFNGRGAHDRDNAALALQAAQLFKISDDAAREIVRRWKSLKGRLELVKKVKNVEFYNDAASVSAYSTQIGLMALSENKNVVLVFGGADRGCRYGELYAQLPHYVHTLILLPGSGTMKERKSLEHLENIHIHSAPSVEEAARLALEYAHKGDRVLFSPGFEAGGVDRTRMERGERFVRAVRNL